MTHPAIAANHLQAGDSHSLQSWRSALTLAPDRQQICMDVQELHRLVMAGFRHPRADAGSRAPRPAGVLFAARRSVPLRDPDTRRLIAGVPQEVLVQSPRQPDWRDLTERGVLTAARVFPVRQHFDTGEPVEGRTFANPIIHDRSTGRNLSRRTVQECGDWLRRQLHRNGLEVSPHHIAMTEGQSLTGMHGNDPVKIIFREAHLTGIVTDSDKFHALLTNGFGRAKAYGCGLLLARPVA